MNPDRPDPGPVPTRPDPGSARSWPNPGPVRPGPGPVPARSRPFPFPFTFIFPFPRSSSEHLIISNSPFHCRVSSSAAAAGSRAIAAQSRSILSCPQSRLVACERWPPLHRSRDHVAQRCLPMPPVPQSRRGALPQPHHYRQPRLSVVAVGSM